MFASLINSFVPRTQSATVQTLGHPAAGVIGWYDSGGSAGVTVTKDTALTVAAFWCGVRIIAETLGTLPCVLYRRTTEDTRERADDDNRYYIVHDQPHPSINPVTFYETLTAHIVCTGNAYARIVTTQGGEIDRLEPRLPETVRVEVKPGDSEPTYTVTNPPETIMADDMLHILGIGGDGITGWSVLHYGERTIGSAIAGDTRSAKQHKSGAIPGGALIHPMKLNKEAREHMRREWNELHQGSDNAGNIAILHGGMDYKMFGMSNEDAQFLESRVLNIRDIARLLRVPLHMLMDLENSSVRANIEQAGIEFLVYSMAPWIVRWQQALNRKLLSREERRSLYFEFLLDALLRGDIKSRYDAYAVARQWGWASVNDILRMENKNSIGPQGDIYLQPSNMVPAGTTPDTITGEMQNNLAQSLSEIMAAGRQLREDMATGHNTMLDAMDAASHSVTQTLASLHADRELIRKDISELGKVQVRGFDDPWPRYKKKERAAVLKAANNQVHRGESFIRWMELWYVDHMADYPEWSEESQRQLLAACDGDPADFLTRIQTVVDSWEERQ